MKSVPTIRSGSTARWRAVPAILFILAATSWAEVPNAIAHQGRIVVTGVNFQGNGQFKFLLFADADTDQASGNETPIWSNASSTPAAMTEPASAVTVAVTKGLYGTWLGDTTIANMAALPASVEPPAGTRLYLRVWLSDGVAPFVALAPDQAIAAVPFALSAASVTQGGVTADALADGAVTAAKIAPGAVTEAKLAPGAVTGAVLGNGSITSEKLAAGAVTGIGTPGLPGHLGPAQLLFARDFDQTNIAIPRSVAVSGNFAYVVDTETQQVQSFNVTDPDNIVAGSAATTNLFIGTSTQVAADIAISGNLLYVIVRGTSTQLIVFDISNPEIILLRDSGLNGLHNPTSIAASGNFAYVVDSFTNRLQIFDAKVPSEIVARDFDTTGLKSPTAIAVSENFAYVVDASTLRLQIFDVSNPNDIVARGFNTTGLSNPNSVAISGNFAYVGDSGSESLHVFDVSNPDNIVAKSVFKTVGIPVDVAVSENRAYVALKVGSSDLLELIDVSNPAAPLSKAAIKDGLFIPSGIAVSGDLIFVTDRAARLQLFSVSDGLKSPSGMSLGGDFRVTGAASVNDIHIFGVLSSASANITGNIATHTLQTAYSASVAGNLSAGSASVTHSLTAASANVSGTVSANNFVYPTPKSFALSIPGNAMLAQSAPDAYFRSTVGFIRPSGVSNSFSGVAPVQLPQGATITGMDIIYYDDSVGNSFTNLTTRLRRLDMFSTSGSPEQNVISLNVPFPFSQNSTTLVRAINNSPEATRNVVDNLNFQYFVTVDATVTAPDADLRFYGFRIRYTLDTLAP